MTARRAVVDRISPNDAMVLATDRGPAPMHLGAVLVLEPAGGATDELDLEAARQILDERSRRVPRLHQVLVRAPLGCGRPYWLDDPAFDITQHVSHRRLPPDGEDALLDAAADLLASPLDRARPLWSASWVTGWDHSGADRSAVVLVLHHVLVDGIGGLAVLGALADHPAPPLLRPSQRRPAAPPGRRTLALDAARERLVALRRAPGAARRMVEGLRELRLGPRRLPAAAARTSLLRPTGRRRRFTTVDVDLVDVVAAAHRHGCTVNDVVLAAVVGALSGLLDRRGEHPSALVVSVPVAERASAADPGLGNRTGVRPVSVPARVGAHERLRAVAAATAALRDTPRAASAAPLGVLFRGLATLGLFRLFVEHQRLVHTFESNLRGPSRPVRFAGRQVQQVIPLVANPGNVGVSFVLLSYAGHLVTTVVADPVVVPDHEVLTGLLHDELCSLVGLRQDDLGGGGHVSLRPSTC